jgi:hypothetical protein
VAQPSPDPFIEAILGYQQTAAIKAAIELDLFSAIAQGKDTAETLGQATGAAVRGIRILCDYLTVQGHLGKQGQAYRLSPSAALFLDRGSPSWIGSVVEYLAAPEMMRLFLDDPAGYVRNGGSVGLGNNAPDHPIWVTFARAMAPFRAPVAAKLAAELAGLAPRRVLDIAAGHGMFGIALARAVPGAEITAVDWQAVLAVAQEAAEAAGVAARYRSLAGSAFEVDWGNGFDLALLANFLHQIDRDGCIALLRRVRGSLAAQGRVAVVELVPEEDRVSPRYPAMFSFQMLGSTPQGEAYTARDFEAMGRAAGFGRMTLAPLPPSPQSLILFERG